MPPSHFGETENKKEEMKNKKIEILQNDLLKSERYLKLLEGRIKTLENKNLIYQMTNKLIANLMRTLEVPLEVPNEE